MNTLWLRFWEIVAAGCLLWYVFATIYIAVRGVADIRGMLANLREENGNEESPSV